MVMRCSLLLWVFCCSLQATPARAWGIGAVVKRAKKVAKKVEKKVEDTVEAVNETVDNATEKAKKAVDNTTQAVKDKVGNTSQLAKEKLDNTTQAVKDKVGNTSQLAKEKLDNTTQATKEKLDNATQAASNKLGNASQAAKDKVGNTTQALENATQKAVDAAGNETRKAAGQMGNATKVAKDAIDSGAHAVEDGAEDLANTIEDAVEDGADKIKNASGKIGNASDGVTKRINDEKDKAVSRFERLMRDVLRNGQHGVDKAGNRSCDVVVGAILHEANRSSLKHLQKECVGMAKSLEDEGGDFYKFCKEWGDEYVDDLLAEQRKSLKADCLESYKTGNFLEWGKKAREVLQKTLWPGLLDALRKAEEKAHKASGGIGKDLLRKVEDFLNNILGGGGDHDERPKSYRFSALITTMALIVVALTFTLPICAVVQGARFSIRRYRAARRVRLAEPNVVADEAQMPDPRAIELGQPPLLLV